MQSSPSPAKAETAKNVSWVPPLAPDPIVPLALPVLEISSSHLEDHLSPACIEPPPSPSWDRTDGRSSFSTTSSFDILEVCSQVSCVCSSSTYEVVEYDLEHNTTPSCSEVGSACTSPRTPRCEQTPTARLLQQRAHITRVAFGHQYAPGCAMAQLQRRVVLMTPGPAARKARSLKVAYNPKSLESKLWRAVVESREPATDFLLAEAVH
eukprot:TRINITY_DN3179_c0_g1_i1.p1 TRINITY_DN3179_c0_g1~~TRINITY_DN3179_c0_g1_i1.p1  ORF type:complete len:216 (+),score=32.07 TRINITY_DN3179_c0_g1_i1:22-648(+)